MLTQDDYETILIDKHANGVAVVTLNRPEKLNAVNAVMHYELSQIFLDAEADAEVRAGRTGAMMASREKNNC